MTELCDRAQETLAAGGIEALTLALREHVADCEACSDVLLALVGLDDEVAAWAPPARPEGLDARVGGAVRAEVAATLQAEVAAAARAGATETGRAEAQDAEADEDDLELELDLDDAPGAPEPTRAAIGATDETSAGAAGEADETWTESDDFWGADEDEPTAPWWRRRPPLILTGSAAALLLLFVGTSLLLVQSGSKVRGLFETADAEIDTVDANLSFDRFPARSAAPRAAPSLDIGWGDEGEAMEVAELAAEEPMERDISGLRSGDGGEGLRGGGGGDGAAGGPRGSSSSGSSLGRRSGTARLDRDSDEWRAMDPDGDGIRRPPGSSDGKNMGDVFRPTTRQRIQNKRNRSSDVSINTPSRSRRSRRGDSRAPSTVEKSVSPSRPSPDPTPSVMRADPEPVVLPEAEAALDAPPPPPKGPSDDRAKDQWTREEQARRLKKEAANKGLLALIGTTGDAEDASVADLLADAEGLSADVGQALAGAAGVGMAKGGGRGYRGPDEGRGELEPGRFPWFQQNAELDVATVAAAGYWANTYVPGDPALRRLESRVRSRREQRMGLGIDPHQLDVTVRQIRQPFDAPTDGALGVYLHADRRGITEPTRMRIQVGIQGTERRSGRRPAMNVGVVLDLRGSPSAGHQAAMRALVQALVKARDLGDTFSLTVAGRPGGQIVPAADFRYGPVRLALESLFGEESTEGATLGLQAAMQRAIDSVGATDDPNRPLGSSVVLLVSPGSLGRDVRVLEAMAHRSAVAGIPVSVVGVGHDADMERLETIALAGQGNRRVLPDASLAEAVVDRELSAASRVIARAVRLRIRLAPGVKLVDVLGSHDLDAAQSQQVREAEQSIDRRLARNLGIQADRGDDEAGIQIVIPTWYAGDGHAILLDVIAPGPGAIADVSVKYKDLVRLSNGSARASLHLGRDPRPPGPLELNVLKNEIARHLSGLLADAADEVTRGRPTAGARVVRAASTWLRGLQRAVPALHGDRELQRDHALLSAYANALDVTNDAESNQFLDDSLRLAARRKVLAPLADDSEGAP